MVPLCDRPAEKSHDFKYLFAVLTVKLFFSSFEVEIKLIVRTDNKKIPSYLLNLFEPG